MAVTEGDQCEQTNEGITINGRGGYLLHEAQVREQVRDEVHDHRANDDGCAAEAIRELAEENAPCLWKGQKREGKREGEKALMKKDRTKGTGNDFT
jgi:hypothetical protein